MSVSIGFKTGFIDSSLPVFFPVLTKEQLADLALINTPPTPELQYPHFSLYLSKSRRFPYFTATNIDGNLFKQIPRKTIFPSGNDEWSIDTRAVSYQWGANLYKAIKSDFQRGHMTKREDPQWGETVDIAQKAAQATFHFSNCVPQVGELNTMEWGKLETYILEKQSVPDKLKVCVLTGPVLSKNDPIFVTEVDGEEVAIPTLFWKIVYYTNDGEKLNCAGFLMGQEDALYKKGIVVQKANANFFEIAQLRANFFQDFEDAAIYQVTLSTIEQLTQLKFSPANEPYEDKRPLKLIINKVQVPPAVEMLEAITQLSMIEDTNEKIEFANIKL